MGDIVNLGTVKAPEAEKLDEPWVFRGACKLFDLQVCASTIYFKMVLDLGFGISRQIEAKLSDVLVDSLNPGVAMFTENWVANGEPNTIRVHALTRSTGDPVVWLVDLERAELDLHTLKVIGWKSLADALEEEGLCTRIES